jgi:polyhydroxyalkanoate synthase
MTHPFSDPYSLKDYHVRRYWLSGYVEAIKEGEDGRVVTQAVVEKLRAYHKGVCLLCDVMQDDVVYADFEVVHHIQSVTLRSYAPLTSGAVPILMIPSLINHTAIFDLHHAQSFVRYLQAQGFHPLVIDWGIAENDVQHYGLQGAIDDYLMLFLDYICAHYARKPIVLGYCLGATLALAAASRSDAIGGLVLLAPPWDFSQLSFAKEQTLCFPYELLNPEATPIVSGLMIYQFLNMPFWEEVGEKYVAASKPTSVHKALDRWIHNPRDLSCVMVKDLMTILLKSNQPETLLAKPLQEISTPTCVVSAQHDHLVPRDAMQPLIEQLPHVVPHIASMGHLGLVASQKAPHDVWEPLVRWIRDVQQ